MHCLYIFGKFENWFLIRYVFPTRFSLVLSFHSFNKHFHREKSSPTQIFFLSFVINLVFYLKPFVLINPMLPRFFKILFTSIQLNYYLYVCNSFWVDNHKRCHICGSFPCVAGFHPSCQHYFLNPLFCLAEGSLLQHQLAVAILEHSTVFIWAAVYSSNTSWLDCSSWTVNMKPAGRALRFVVLQYCFWLL